MSGKDEEKKRPEFPLKGSGEPADVAVIRIWERAVRRLLEENPALFQSLRSLVEGRKDEVPKEHVQELRHELFLNRDRSVLPGPRAIIETCYRETADGPCIVDPFDVKTTADAARLQEAEESNARSEREFNTKLNRAAFDKKAYRRLIREIHEEDDENKDKGKGRPR